MDKNSKILLRNLLKEYEKDNNTLNLKGGILFDKKRKITVSKTYEFSLVSDVSFVKCLYFCFNDISIISLRTFKSISSSLFMYMQPTPALCLPNFLRAAAFSLRFIIRYKDRFVFRGEKPIRSQSTSLPLDGLLYLLIPKPTIELLHNIGSSPVAFFIISKSTKLSLRFCSLSILLIKSSTLAEVGFVFTTASFEKRIDTELISGEKKKTRDIQ